MEAKPKVDKMKSHIANHEVAAMARLNEYYDRWIYSNEAADVAVGAITDHQGPHDEALCKEPPDVQRLRKILRRVSVIRLDIREEDEGVPMFVENIIAAAGAQCGRRVSSSERGSMNRFSRL